MGLSERNCSRPQSRARRGETSKQLSSWNPLSMFFWQNNPLSTRFRKKHNCWHKVICVRASLPLVIARPYRPLQTIRRLVGETIFYWMHTEDMGILLSWQPDQLLTSALCGPRLSIFIWCLHIYKYKYKTKGTNRAKPTVDITLGCWLSISSAIALSAWCLQLFSS